MKNKKKTVAYIGGTFDLMHNGHVSLFREAKKIADFVVVSLNTDEFNEEYKGRKPVMSLQERIDVVSSCKYVDKVDINDGGRDSKPAILRNKPDYLIHGEDWVKGEIFLKQLDIDKKFLKENGIEVRYMPLVNGISSTELRRRVKTQKKPDIPQRYKNISNKRKTAKKEKKLNG